MCTGARYLRGYIGDNESKSDCPREITLTWEKNISRISKTAGKYPQESSAAVVRAIQSEWIFIQRITWDTGDELAGEEKMIWETFLPCLFFGNKKPLPPIVGDLSTMQIRMEGLGLLNPATPAKEKELITQRGSEKLIWAVMGGGKLSNANHLWTLG